MNVPRLRFKNEIGKDFPAWEKKYLADVTKRIMDGTHFSPKSKDGSRKYLTSKNVRNEGLDLSNISYITEEEHLDIYKKCPVKFGDILITKDGANTGNCCLNTLEEEFSLLSSVAVIDGKPDLLNNMFLLQILQSQKGINAVSDVMAGQAITRITLEKIKKFNFFFPIFLEQTKIANFLTAVDEKITQLSQKGDLLAQYKKGVMQQIFSQELRFKDDDGRDFQDWEEKKLKDLVLSPITYGVVKPGGYDINGIKLIRGGDILQGKINKNLRTITQELSSQYSRTILQGGELLVSLVGNPGEVALVTKDLIGANLARQVGLVRLTKEVNSHFALYYLMFRTEAITSKVTGSVQKVINLGDLQKVKIKYSSLLEQTKIANFLIAIDDKINHNQTQLNAMKQYKQGLLQQLFV